MSRHPEALLPALLLAGLLTPSLRAQTTVSVAPSPASGPTSAFTVVASNPGGYDANSTVQLLVNWDGLGYGADACYLIYNIQANALYLMDDTGTTMLGGLAPGSTPSVPLQNGQCAINVAQTAASVSGNTVTLTPSITFDPSFVGSLQVSSIVFGASGSGASFPQVETYTAYAASSSQPTVSMSVVENTGNRISSTATVTVSDPNGAKYIRYVSYLADICGVAYVPGAYGFWGLELSTTGQFINPYSLLPIPTGTGSGSSSFRSNGLNGDCTLSYSFPGYFARSGNAVVFTFGFAELALSGYANPVPGVQTQFTSSAIDGAGTNVSGSAVPWTMSDVAITPSTQYFTSAGGSGTIAVTANSATSWTLTAPDSWFHIVSGGSGRGNGTVSFTVDPNTSSSPLVSSEAIDYNPLNIIVSQPGPAAQTITFNSLQNVTMGAAPFTLSASASSGLTVTFASLTLGVCTVSNVTVTVVGPGTCTIQATQSGNSSWVGANPVNQRFTVNATHTGSTQTITFNSLPNQALGAPPFTLTASASSGLTVGFESLTTGVCTISGTTVTLVSLGGCVIYATQPGNSTYAAANPVEQGFDVLATQTISFNSLPNQTMGASPFTVTATASSGLAVSFASLTTAVCTVSGSTVTLVATGTCTIQASQGGNSPQWAAAAPVNQGFTVLATQTITFNSLPTQTMGNPPFTISASASSGQTVTFTSTTSGVCTVSGNTVTLVNTGTCSITASQPGNGTYAAAPNVVQSFGVNPLVQLTLNQPGAQGVQIGSWNAFTATISSTNVNADVTVSGSALPAGIAVMPVTIPQGSTSGIVAFTASSSASPGTYSFSLTASGGGLYSTQIVSLTISSTPYSPRAVGLSSNTAPYCSQYNVLSNAANIYYTAGDLVYGVASAWVYNEGGQTGWQSTIRNGRITYNKFQPGASLASNSGPVVSTTDEEADLSIPASGAVPYPGAGDYYLTADYSFTNNSCTIVLKPGDPGSVSVDQHTVTYSNWTIAIRGSDLTPVISYVNPSSIPPGQTVNVTIGGQGFGSYPTVNVGSQSFTPGQPGTDSNGNEIVTVAVIGPSTSTGTSLAVTITSTGEFGDQFQTSGGSNPSSSTSQAAQLQVDPQITAPQITFGTTCAGSNVAGSAQTVYIGQQIALTGCPSTALPIVSRTWSQPAVQVLPSGVTQPLSRAGQ